MSDNKVTLTIDGREIQADAGSMLIEVADAAGIHIPRFCYHRKLSVAANCRMCMVDVEKTAKPVPACATPIADGMVVSTQSARARGAQKSAMEFLLINHPLDCPICDQGGECELQDVAMGYGGDVSQYVEAKRVVPDPDIGPLIETEMTRCIHCTRCVRFGEEIAGVRELGATGRGEFMRIGTYVEKSVRSELSGNVIDLCPVGALTAKPSRYQARPWELSQHPALSVHDAVGANLYLHSRKGAALRVVPRDNEAVNECWIADRDRFSYMALASADRVRQPLVKVSGHWQTADWQTALNRVTAKLRSIHPNDVAALLSPYQSTEELYLAQKYLRGLGISDLDHRSKEVDFSDQEQLPLFPWLGTAIAALEEHNAVLLIGSNLRKDQPLLAQRLSKAVHRGATVDVINPVDFYFYFPVADHLLVDAEGMVQQLAALAKATGSVVPEPLQSLVADSEAQDAIDAMAQRLKQAESGLVLLGSIASYHPQASVIRALASAVSKATGAQLGFLPTAGNSAGAWLAGAVPHRGPAGRALEKPGVNRSKRAEPAKALFVLGTELEADSQDAFAASQELLKADFVVALSAFESDLLKTAADVILPIATPFETAGTYVNAEGRWQTIRAATQAPDEVRPAWKVLRVLGNLAELEGFDFNSAADVLDELKAQFSANVELDNAIEPAKRYPEVDADQSPTRMSGDAIYACDPMTRRSQALQRTEDADANVAILGLSLAKQYDIETGDSVELQSDDGTSVFTAKVTDGIADNLVYTTFGGSASAKLSGGFGSISLRKCGGES